MARSGDFDRLTDPSEFVLRFRRLDEDDVGTGLRELSPARYRLVEAKPSARVGAGDDEGVISRACRERHLDLATHVAGRDHAAVRRMAAFLRHLLILDLDRLHARGLVAAHGLAYVDQPAEARVGASAMRGADTPVAIVRGRSTMSR